jgi:hypothetical protein
LQGWLIKRYQIGSPKHTINYQAQMACGQSLRQDCNGSLLNAWRIQN